MQVITTISELKTARAELETAGKTVGFAATMGALHAGHLQLIKRAKAENDAVIVSIFVNPTQFGANEDFSTYPRKPEADKILVKAAGADILFMPTAQELYSDDETSVKAPPKCANILEGAVRPTHFDGVLTVVLKLFNLMRPNRAYFGKKDAQQLVIIQKMVERLFLDITIVAVETEREYNGLALSSRNSYLDSDQLGEALKLSKSLFEASKLIITGEKNSSVIKAAIAGILSPLAVDYIAVVDRNLREINMIIKDDTIILIAARVGSVRLIDNMWI